MNFFKIAAHGIVLCGCIRRADILVPLPRITNIAILILIVALHCPRTGNDNTVPIMRIIMRLSKIRGSVSIVFIELEFPFAV